MFDIIYTFSNTLVISLLYTYFDNYQQNFLD